MKFLFLALLLAPLTEIYFMVQVGGVVGAGMTVFLVVFTAVVGLYLVRQQGFATLQKAQTMMRNGENPAVEMMEGVALFVAGAFLLIPGFVSDAFGFILLVPFCRRYIIYRFIALQQTKFHQHNNTQSNNQANHRVIEGEFKDSD